MKLNTQYSNISFHDTIIFITNKAPHFVKKVLRLNHFRLPLEAKVPSLTMLLLVLELSILKRLYKSKENL